jgi:hypothetical protein
MPDFLKYDNISFSERGVFEIQRGRQVAGVLAPDIKQIRLQYGTGANRPIFEAIVGTVLLLVGIKGLLLFIAAPMGFRYELALMVLGAIGASMLFDVLKRRYVLCVFATDRVHKLSFSGSANLAGIEIFRDEVHRRFGIEIQSEIPFRSQ